MDDKKKETLAAPFSVHGFLQREKRPMEYCMVTNMGVVTEIPSMEERAAIHVQNPSIEYVGAKRQYTESGVSNRDFQGMVIYQLGMYLQNGYARHLEFVDDGGCAIFEADPALLGQLKEAFPSNRFAFQSFKGYSERDLSIKNYFGLRKENAESHNLIKPRPYLDS